jgi:hypothetical protein
LPSLAEEVLDNDSRAIDALTHSTIIVLAGGWATAAASDLESKWGESGFGAVTVTDARNFAHGRHVGLARRGGQVAVVSLVTADEPDASLRTVKRLPTAVSTAIIDTPLFGEAAGIDLVVRVIALAGKVGLHNGVDPGRPRVPSFGRALYHDGISQESG